VLRPAAIAVVAVAGIGVGYLAWTAVSGPPGVPLTSPTPDRGRAATQFGAVEFYLRVDEVRRDAAGLRLELTFTNRSREQQRADPLDFTLQGRRPVFEPGCPDWGRVDLYPPAGARDEPLRDPGGTRAGPVWGPSTLCFPEPVGSEALTLVWEPDVAFGPLSEPIRIPLR
jgi:hypothetical protein